jgi:N-acetylglucosaminyl-diphospho-decaprenol L-rhamnosyltransferase
MTEQADIAILIVAHRSRDTLPRVLDQLQAQTLAPARVLVLENGSPEGEAVDEAVIAGRAELVVSETNLGFAAGNNRLAAQVDQSWIFLLNPDAFPEPDLIETLVGATMRYPDVSLFGCAQTADGAPGVLDGAGDVYHVTGVPYRGGYGRRMAPPPDGECFAPCGAATLIRRDVFERLGGFDEDYFCYVEDVDLGFRARLSGETCVQLNSAVVSHVGYGSSGPPVGIRDLSRRPQSLLDLLQKHAGLGALALNAAASRDDRRCSGCLRRASGNSACSARRCPMR